VDRWNRTDGEYDRWAEDGRYDRWAEDGRYDRWAEDGQYDRWAEDGQYDRPERPASRNWRPAFKWVGLLIAWVIVTALLSAAHLGVLIWVIMVALIGYVVYSIRRTTPPTPHPRRRLATAGTAYDGPEQFNAPPGWPEPPPGWTPPPGWHPNPAWPPAPAGWQFWLPPSRRALGGRRARNARAQDRRSHRSHRGEVDGDRYTDRWL
jgi:hypothetical protein